MNNQMQIFHSEQFGDLRAMNMDNVPWFVGIDVATALGYAKARNALANHVDAEDKTTALIQGAGSNYKSKAILINESGLYSLILSSKLESAKQFKRWVTSEVLPSIRKYGAYMADNIIDALQDNPDAVPMYLNRLRDENAHARELRKQLDDKTEQLSLVQPKADYYDAYVGVGDALCFRYVAKELGVPERKLIGYFEHELKCLYRDAHRGNRVFPRANAKTAPLFTVRDFYDRWGKMRQYTVLSLEGRDYAMRHVNEISTFERKKEDVCPEEICLDDLAKAAV